MGVEMYKHAVVLPPMVTMERQLSYPAGFSGPCRPRELYTVVMRLSSEGNMSLSLCNVWLAGRMILSPFILVGNGL